MENKKLSTGAIMGIVAVVLVIGCILGVLIGLAVGNKNEEAVSEKAVITASPVPTATAVPTASPEAQTQVSSNDKTPSVPKVQKKSDYSSVISNRSAAEIEDYISSYVRPLYEEVNRNLDNYSEYTQGQATCWDDGTGCVRKYFPSGANGYEMEREYYYDTESGRIAFAFVYNGMNEYRLYFRTNQLVRFIAPGNALTDNPTDAFMLEMAGFVLSEAY